MRCCWAGSRKPPAATPGGDPPGANRAYFAALAEWGYTLSEVETFVLVDPDSTADTDTDTADLHPAAGADEVEQPGSDTDDGEQEGQTEAE